jgi:hypothetical protein
VILGGRIAMTVVMASTFSEGASAQDSSQQPPPEKERVIIDLTLPPRRTDSDPLADRQCAEEADAARIAGEIVVCRSLDEDTDGVWDREAFERDYAARTQGPVAPNVDGSGIKLPGEGSVFTVTVTAKVGDPPPPTLMIDIEALPEAPPGSDADRIGRGEGPP